MIRNVVARRCPGLYEKLKLAWWRLQAHTTRLLNQLRLNSKEKKAAELSFWIKFREQLTTGCNTDAEREEALLRACIEDGYARYSRFLELDENSFTGKRVLDVACGPITGLLGFKDCEKYGVDHLIDDYKEIGYPLDKHDITYAHAPAESIPFESGFFDVILCSNALDHVDSLPKTMREFSRLLKPGGTFIGQINLHPRPTKTEPICLTHDEILAAARRGGLRLMKVEYQGHVPEMEEDRFIYRLEKA